MTDRERIEAVLSEARRRVSAARETLGAIDDGDLEDLRPKYGSVSTELEALGERLEELGDLLSAAVEEPTRSEPPDETGSEDVVPEAADDLFSLEDQHAVSRLMRDTAVHLAVRRGRGFWEIRHRHTEDGQPSEPLRAETIAEAYALYEEDAVRKGPFEPPEPRPLSAGEQSALAAFRDLAIDNPRSIRWERTKTEIDYLDRSGEVAGGNKDAVEFPPGSLIGPIEHLVRVLG